MPVVLTKAFSIWEANREKPKYQGCYDKVQVELQGIEFYLTFFSLSLISLDLILGMQWLEMLGFMVCNGKQLTKDFIWDN